jgi:hypothetical protein
MRSLVKASAWRTDECPPQPLQGRQIQILERTEHDIPIGAGVAAVQGFGLRLQLTEPCNGSRFVSQKGRRAHTEHAGQPPDRLGQDGILAGQRIIGGAAHLRRAQGGTERHTPFRTKSPESSLIDLHVDNVLFNSTRVNGKEMIERLHRCRGWRLDPVLSGRSAVVGPGWPSTPTSASPAINH